MGILQNIAARFFGGAAGREERSTVVGGISLATVFGYGSTAISAQQALTVDAVFRCVDILSKSVAALPLDLYRVAADGGRARAAHPAARVLRGRPNGFQNRYIFWQTLLSHVFLHGNGVAVVVRRDGFPSELRIAAPGTVYFGVTDAGEQVYMCSLLRPDGTMSDTVTVFGDDVLHLRTMSVDGVSGLDVVRLNAAPINALRFANQYASTYYEKGANMAAVIEAPGELSDKAVSRLRQSISTFHAGADKAGGVMVLEGGLKFVPLGSKLSDTSANETKKVSVEQIARIFGVPMHMLAALERATFNNIEHLSQQFVNDTLRPIAEQIEAELSAKLLTDAELLSGEYEFAFDFSALLRGDQRTQLERTRQLVQAGVISVNEARLMQRLNPVDGKDVFYVPLNVNTGNEAEPDGEAIDDNQQAADGAAQNEE